MGVAAINPDRGVLSGENGEGHGLVALGENPDVGLSIVLVAFGGRSAEDLAGLVLGGGERDFWRKPFPVMKADQVGDERGAGFGIRTGDQYNGQAPIREGQAFEFAVVVSSAELIREAVLRGMRRIGRFQGLES